MKTMDSVQLRHLRFLNMSAASGLLLRNESFYVIADDELSLHIYSKNLNNPIQKIQLVNDLLPEEVIARKILKPDFESLVYISTIEAILVVPSGSTARRTKGVLIHANSIIEINFDPLYSSLHRISHLNIEGAVIAGEQIKLFHRGNGPGEQNMIICLSLFKVLEEIQSERAVTGRSFENQTTCELGQINGQILGITDAAVEDKDHIWFLAAAESGNSTYLDGEFIGSVIGCMDSQNRILGQKKLNCSTKPEGLALDILNQKFYIVTDPDNRRQSSELLEGDLFHISR